MNAYLLRRVAAIVPVWFAISLLAFALAGLAPGDPATVILEQQTGQQPTAEQIAELRQQLGLDDAWALRYGRWVADAARGDLGTSYRSGQDVAPVLAGKFLVTLRIAIPALVIALSISVLAGVVSAVRRDTFADHASRLGSMVGASMPGFWLAYLLIIVFSVKYHLLPVAGSGTWRHLVLPSVTLGVAPAAILTRLTRSSMLEVMGEDYVRTAQAMGYPRRVVVVRHALRNALIPVVTVAGLRFGHLLAGAVIIETVFAFPGLGQHIVEAIYNRDYPTIQGFVLFTGSIFLFLNLAIDVLYARLDPRVQLGARAGGGS